ncbi:MAG: 4-hydroxy-tetrahydrodipicolinate reductase [Thermaerobacter sp.]|nr:4-hydroxy-tetrahydrodipicolinate reductase [Thermaerobacter sp.]
MQRQSTVPEAPGPSLINVVVAGATGWVGSALVPAILAAPDLTLVGAVARRHAGQDVGTALGGSPVGVTVVPTVPEALAMADVLVEFTSATSVQGHVLAALDRGVHVVVGSSGLDPADDPRLDAHARERGLGVVVAGNFSLVATLAKRLALIAAAEMPGWEVVDYAAAAKPDAPSGTACEWAAALGAVHSQAAAVPVSAVVGHPQARGATIAGVQVHSVRVPGYVLSTALLAGAGDERLTIRYDAGQSPAPYLTGTLHAIRRVTSLRGLVRGLEQVWP